MVRWGHPHAHDIREVGVSDGAVVAGPQELARPPSGGGAFLADAAAAAAAARAFGLSDRAIRVGLGSFAPLPHRGTVVSEVGSIRFVDDSKATNPHAALAALEGLSDAVLIAGGLAKGVDLSPLASAAPGLGDPDPRSLRQQDRGGGPAAHAAADDDGPLPGEGRAHTVPPRARKSA